MSARLDLTTALHDAARAATGGRHTMAAEPVLQRIRHRRVVRQATQAGLGVAAAGAVAFAATQAPWRAVAPPAESPTTSPTPTAVPTTDDRRCGTPLGARMVLPPPDSLVEGPLAESVVAPGEALHVFEEPTVEDDGSFSVPVGYDFLAVRDGVVVAVDDTDEFGASPGGRSAWTVELAACTDVANSDGTLPDGDYELHAMLRGTAAGGPWPFTIGDGGGDGEPVEEPADEEPTAAPTVIPTAVTLAGPVICGEPMPELVDPPGDAELRIEAGWAAGDAPIVWATGGSAFPDLTLVNATGSAIDLKGLANGGSPQDVLQRWLVRNGVVVGYLGNSSVLIDADFPPSAADIALGAGERFAVNATVVPQGCQLDGGVPGTTEVPTGELELLVTAELWGPDATVPDDPSLTTVVGGPFPVVVEE